MEHSVVTDVSCYEISALGSTVGMLIKEGHIQTQVCVMQLWGTHKRRQLYGI